MQLAPLTDQSLASNSAFQALMCETKHWGRLIDFLVITEIKGLLLFLFVCLIFIFFFFIRLLYSTTWAGLFIERAACRDVKFQGKLSDPASLPIR